MTPTSWLLVIAGLGLGVVYAARAVAVAVLRRRRSAAHPSHGIEARLYIDDDVSLGVLPPVSLGRDTWPKVVSDPDGTPVDIATWLAWSEHVDPDGFVVEDTGLSGWDGSKGP